MNDSDLVSAGLPAESVQAIRSELFGTGDPLDVSVVVPAYNEAESLPELLDRIQASLTPITERFEVLVIDDGSTDSTREVLAAYAQRHPWLVAVHFLRNYGKSPALAVGFDRARGSVVFTIDADLQDDPAEFGPLLVKLAEGYDLVSGWKQERKDPWIKNSTSKIFNAVTGLASGLRLHDFNCGLKVYRSQVTASLQVYGEMHRYLPVLAHVMGFRVAELPVRHRARQHGETKFGRSRFLNGLLDLLTVIFLSRQQSSPLHFFGRVGLAFSAVGSLIMFYFLGVWLVEHALRIRPLMLVGVALLLVGVQFVSLGLIAELFVATREDVSRYRIRDEI
ncbi:glycosyltransferase [bacterium]|nr:MAG: glycosyltransferase [bacterium]